MTKKKTFSIIVPVYQNEANLNDTVPKLMGLKDLIDYELELVFVDDGSRDRSFEMLSRFHGLYPGHIKVVKLTRNFGQTPAIQAGLKIASGDCCGIISADLQDPCELFVEMLKLHEKGTKLVVCERTGREEKGLHRLVSSLFWKLLSKYAVKDFPEGGFDFCLMDRQVRDTLISINEKNTAIFPLIFSLGYPHEVIPYTRRLRKSGKSQWTFSKKLKITIDTFLGFSYLPVRLISFMGIATSGMAFLYSLFILVRWLFLGSGVQGWTSIIILNAFLGGMILLSLGILSEYLWRILDEARKRPVYVVDRILGEDTEKQQ